MSRMVAPLLPVVSLRRNLGSYRNCPAVTGNTLTDCCSITSWAVAGDGSAEDWLGTGGDGRGSGLGPEAVGLPLHPLQIRTSTMKMNTFEMRMVVSRGRTDACGRQQNFQFTVIRRPVTSPVTCASTLPAVSNWSTVNVPL